MRLRDQCTELHRHPRDLIAITLLQELETEGTRVNNAPERIPALELPLTRAEVERQAIQNLQRLNRTTDLAELRAQLLATFQLPIAQKGRMNRALKIAQAMSKAIVPHSACRSGCSYCCHTSVAVSQLEAQMIGDAIGLAPLSVAPRQSREEIEQYHRKPCPFLKDSKCSIYAVRPMACRLMFNMANTPYFCNTDINPEDSHVTQLNLKDIELAFTGTFLDAGFADIRDFFPEGGTSKSSSRRN